VWTKKRRLSQTGQAAGRGFVYSSPRRAGGRTERRAPVPQPVLGWLTVANRDSTDGPLQMAPQDLVGWVASGLVLATFCAKRMATLRVLAIASNLAFVGYAYPAHLWPIVVLHSIMLPINAARLYEMLCTRSRAASRCAGRAPGTASGCPQAKSPGAP
jgi:hypothetical protein